MQYRKFALTLSKEEKQTTQNNVRTYIKSLPLMMATTVQIL